VVSRAENQPPRSIESGMDEALDAAVLLTAARGTARTDNN
jgi:hypothetical protein